MDRVNKFLARTSQDDRLRIDEVWRKIIVGDIQNLDVKKLKGFKNVFRVRVGRFRLIFIKEGATPPTLVRISHRDDTTYHL